MKRREKEGEKEEEEKRRLGDSDRGVTYLANKTLALLWSRL